MKYKVHFSKGWQGSWIFEALNDIKAWETAESYIKEHTMIVVVEISGIWELDQSGNAIRKLDNYEDYFKPYKIYYKNGNCILNISKEKDDFLVWNEAKEMIKEHTQVEKVKIDSIYELDEDNRQIRKLPEYEECKIKSVRIEQEKREKRDEIIYIAYFIDGTRSEPFIVRNSQIDIFVKEIAEQKFSKKIETIEKLLLEEKENYIAYFSDGTRSEPFIVRNSQIDVFAKENAEKKFSKKIETIERLLLEEKAIYKAYFSDGTYSGPYITEIIDNDIDAKKMAKYKLKQHAEYNGLDVNKLRVVKIEELNEDNNFVVNREFIERNNRRKNKLQPRKNRFIEYEGL
jgi:hypothetical protein